MNTPEESSIAKQVDTSAEEASLYEVRKKIYPRAVSGIFAKWRVAMVLFTQLIFYGLPWLPWNDRQAVLLDLATRKFYIFGLVLWPQDVIYLTALLVISALALFLFTAIGGRLFCGYACPQTVYTEIFMWVERKIEGDRFARIRLDTEPWTAKKIRLKVAKHSAWVAIALWTGFTFVGYFTPIKELAGLVLSLSLGPWQIFWLLFYSFATWGNAGFMREQVCKYMCPYARFQSAMVDKDTYVVTYDSLRGESRGSRSKKVDHKAKGLGDCVDCGICVQVCPTGIDIRNGLQYECIGCGACIDACNQVMDKMSYPQGLIRYTSENGMLKKWTPEETRKHIFRPRVLIYSMILLGIIAAFLLSLGLRSTIKADILRDRGALSREVEGGQIENVYRIQLMNSSEKSIKLKVEVEGLDAATLIARDTSIKATEGGKKNNAFELTLEPSSNRLVPVKVRVPGESIPSGNHKIRFEVRELQADGKVAEKGLSLSEPSVFIMPR